MKVAVLLTCFNRKANTKACLENLYSQETPSNIDLEVFLCDDGSTDGTSEMIFSNFPQVNVVKGSGKLYWCGGMNAAWKLADQTQKFDYFIWLNDDTFLLDQALIKLFEESNALDKKAILTAACKKPETDEFSYGGWSETGPVPPTGLPQTVKFINGNLVLIPRAIFLEIGMVSRSYTHYLGDYDYGMRAQEAGFECYTTTEYLAECDTNEIPYWGDPKLPLAKRWKMTHDVKGLALKEYLAYKKYHHGSRVAFKTWIDTYLKVLFPTSYTRLRERKRK